MFYIIQMKILRGWGYATLYWKNSPHPSPPKKILVILKDKKGRRFTQKYNFKNKVSQSVIQLSLCIIDVSERERDKLRKMFNRIVLSDLLEEVQVCINIFME